MSYYTSAPPPGAGGPPPAPAAARWHLSGWWRRVGSALIDGFVIGAVAGLLLAVVLVGAGGDSTGFFAVMAALALWGLFAVVVALLYAPWMMARTGGRTLGRMSAGTRVVRANGKPMDFGWSVLREVVVKWLLFYVVGGLISLGLIPLLDVLWPLWDEENRALHDFVVNTRTVRA